MHLEEVRRARVVPAVSPLCSNFEYSCFLIKKSHPIIYGSEKLFRFSYERIATRLH